MTSRHILAAAAVFAAVSGAPALAHSELEEATIADDSEIAAAPESLFMTFSEPVALAGVMLMLEGGAEIPVVFEASSEPAATFTVGLPALEPGAYDFTWRALGDDGHVMTDTIDFTVMGGASDAHPASPAEVHGGDHDAVHEGSAGHGEHAEH